VLSFESDAGIPGQPILRAAGNNSNLGGGYNNGDFGVTPSWKGLFTESWNGESLSLSLTERWVGAGFINPEWIECQAPNCPLPTLQNPTIDSNRLPGAIYLDIGGKYQATKDVELYFKVDNLLDKNPPPYGNSSVYDWFGRIYRAGVRVTH
jgi:outer membrane receptor protein involved in Fe transport